MISVTQQDVDISDVKVRKKVMMNDARDDELSLNSPRTVKLNYTRLNYKRHHLGCVKKHQHDFLYVPQRKPLSERARQLAASRWCFFGGRSLAAWQPCALQSWQG